MSRKLTASDRKSLIRLASKMEKGSPERKAILAGLKYAYGDERPVEPINITAWVDVAPGKRPSRGGQWRKKSLRFAEEVNEALASAFEVLNDSSALAGESPKSWREVEEILERKGALQEYRPYVRMAQKYKLPADAWYGDSYVEVDDAVGDVWYYYGFGEWEKQP